MKSINIICAFSILTSISLLAQAPAPPVQRVDPQPIYRVTVVSRTLQAVNYEHRGGPTKIDFQGTVLLAHAKGEAVVESKRGRVTIDVKLEGLEPPARFGPEYLTYVLWAITPEGRAKNLGEVLVDSSNKAHFDVTANLQAFGMIVTAEPYYSVTTPSDVVVLENVVRPDTIGMREAITARYDLLPRGSYVMNVQHGQLRQTGGEKLSYDKYEAVLELYQAENAVQIARSLGADRYAPESFNKAMTLLQQARDLQTRKMDTHMVVSTAREAAQMAEDARVIAVKRRDDEERQREAQQAHEQGQARIRTEAEAERAQAQAAQEQIDAERAAQRAREDAEAAREQEAEQAARTRIPPPAPVVATPVPRAPFELTASQRQSRAELLASLNQTLQTRDTPRGLVVTVPDSLFEPGESGSPKPAAAERLRRLAAILRNQPGLTIRVEAYTDDRGRAGDDEALSLRRAQAVREALVQNGLPERSITSEGYGQSRPIASNATVSGREQNRRVEIVLAGPRIGEMALWERTYPLQR